MSHRQLGGEQICDAVVSESDATGIYVMVHTQTRRGLRGGRRGRYVDGRVARFRFVCLGIGSGICRGFGRRGRGEGSQLIEDRGGER